ncbi:ABC transporter substrate-binding protein [Fusobacteria bacterium ZRK30]|nr:ABC transporter substrate-binding protein [Fusobacteria bacterium ZRK30]
MRVKMLILLVLTSLGLIGCGGSGEKKPVERSLVVASGNFNGDFYEGWTNTVDDNNIRKLVWGSGLYAATPTGERVLSPMVESLVKSKSNEKDIEEIWTFKIKEGLKFSNGQPLTAKDVKFTYDFFMNNEALNATGATSTLSQFVDRIEFDEENNSVSYYIKDVLYIIDGYFMYNTLSKDIIEAGAKKDNITPQQWVKANINTPVGNGPYMISEYVPSQYVKLVINPYYIGNYEGDKPSIKTIIMQNVPEETKMNQLVAGEIDVISGVTSEEDINTVKSDPHLATNTYLRHGGGQLTFHTDFGPVQLLEVREAFSYMLDRIKFRQILIGDYAIETNAPYSRNMWMMYDDDEKLGTPSRFEATLKSYDIVDADGNWDEQANLKEARRLLDQAAKKTDGAYVHLTKVGDKYLWRNKPLELTFGMTPFWVDPVNLTLTKKIQEEFGMLINIEAIDWSILSKHLYSSAPASERRYHLFAGSTSYAIKTDYSASKADRILPFGQGVTSNTSRYPISDDLLDRMRYADPSSEEGKIRYKKAFREYMKVMNTEIPQVPLYTNIYYDAYPSDLVDFETSPLWRMPEAIVKAKFK